MLRVLFFCTLHFLQLTTLCLRKNQETVQSEYCFFHLFSELFKGVFHYDPQEI